MFPTKYRVPVLFPEQTLESRPKTETPNWTGHKHTRLKTYGWTDIKKWIVSALKSDWMSLVYLASSFHCFVNLLQEISFPAAFGVSDRSGIRGFWYQNIWPAFVNPSSSEYIKSENLMGWFSQKWKFCHYLFALMSFQTYSICFSFFRVA